MKQQKNNQFACIFYLHAKRVGFCKEVENEHEVLLLMYVSCWDQYYSYPKKRVELRLSVWIYGFKKRMIRYVLKLVVKIKLHARERAKGESSYGF